MSEDAKDRPFKNIGLELYKNERIAIAAAVNRIQGPSRAADSRPAASSKPEKKSNSRAGTPAVFSGTR